MAKGTFQVVVNCNRTFQKITPLHRIILSTCAVLQDASAPAQLKRALSGNKNQGEPTFFTLVTRKRARRANEFHRKLKRGVLKAERIRKKNSTKIWINKSSVQLRNLHDFLTEIVLYNQSLYVESRIKTSREFIFRII